MKVRLTAVAAVATLLSSVGLYPLFVGAGWVVPGVGAVLAVSAAGLLTRRLRLPAPVNLLALLLYVTTVYSSAYALIGVVPTRASLSHLNVLLHEGWDVANRYAAPVPLGPGVGLMATL